MSYLDRILLILINFTCILGIILWDPASENSQQVSQPVLLPDCSKDGHDDIAVAVSNTEIQVMFDGNSVSSFAIFNCDSVPTKLESWTRKDESDLIFSCKRDGKGTKLITNLDSFINL